MLIFGEPISAKEAYHFGLLNKVVEEDEMEKKINDYIMKCLNLSG